MTRNSLPLIGWREWLALPGLGVDAIKVKVDTGARSSSLHAFDLRYVCRGDKEFVHFAIHPHQRTSAGAITTRARVIERRAVRSSSGRVSVRPVIVPEVKLLGMTWPIELTLANRDEMGFRMLLGREAVRGRFLVDPGKSFYGGKPTKQPRRGRKEKRRG